MTTQERINRRQRNRNHKARKQARAHAIAKNAFMLSLIILFFLGLVLFAKLYN